MSISTAPGGGERGGETPFEVFDLTVSLGPDSSPWLSAASCAGFVHGVPRHGDSVPPLPDLLDRVYDYTDAVQFAEFEPTPELSDNLRSLVFGDAMVLELFQATRGVAAQRGRQMLVRILASPHLAVLPWELLPDPSAPGKAREHRYLALAPDAHVVRVARGRSYATRTATLEPPLNLLIVLSSPTPQDDREDWLAFDIFEVKRHLLAELAPLVEAGLLCIDVEDRPTVENLRRRIGAQRRGYHLFHYVGHAVPDRLIVEDRAGRREDMTSGRLADLLRLCPDLRLAFFAGCETARAAADPASLDARAAVGWRDLLSLADYTVQEACPAVIGMQAVLPFSTERVLTRFFYQGLASGYSIAAALRLARGAVQSGGGGGGDLLDWSVPALFVGGSEPGPLLQRSAETRVPATRRRVDLKLGLRQRNERFFARDLPLRQTVDTLAGLTRERVLVVTGAVGVGTTSLVERALEELGEAVERLLYIHFDRLVPEVARACRELEAGRAPAIEPLARLSPDDALVNLCRLADELLRLGGQVVRRRDEAWKAHDWWERLVEDLVQHKLVLAIDEVGLLDSLEKHLSQALIVQWLSKSFSSSHSGAIDGRVPPRHAGKRRAKVRRPAALTRHAEGDLVWLLAALREPDNSDLAWSSVKQDLRMRLERMDIDLSGMPRRLLDEKLTTLELLLEKAVVVAPQSGSTASTKALFEAWPLAGQASRARLIGALKAVDKVRTALGDALRSLADRRSRARIVITAVEAPKRFLDLPVEEIFEMRLAQLTWPETWRWIRRNLHGLVGYGDVYLSRIWSMLGTRLDLWEELERRVLRAQTPADDMRGRAVKLEALAAEIAPPARAGIATNVTSRAPRGERPLRIAAAGPHLAEPRAVAEAMTRLAIENGVAGRVVFDAANGAGALATLINEPGPFEDGASELSAVIRWLERVGEQQPDIILLDYGAVVLPSEVDVETPHRAILRQLHYRSLLIAAGGNEPNAVVVPSAYREVLGVGPLDDAGQLQPYATWHSEREKPDFFMADNLAGTPLASALRPGVLTDEDAKDVPRGSSFAALNAVAVAALVWSILPELLPRRVRLLLLEACVPVGPQGLPRKLTVERAVELARARVVERTLRAGPCSLQTLGAITGVDLRALSITLGKLITDGRVVKLPFGRLERFQLV